MMKNKDQFLLENAYTKVLENYSFRMGGAEPPIDPPEYYESDGPECPECHGPMKDILPGGSDKWEWKFVCRNEDCDGRISGDNFP
jgi:hypothetical protein